MFIAIVGTRLSGKSTVQEYLVNFKGFKVLRLVDRDNSSDGGHSPYSHGPTSSNASSVQSLDDANFLQVDSPFGTTRSFRPTSFLMMHSPITPTFSGVADTPPSPAEGALAFTSHTELLDYVTKNWRADFVTSDLTSQHLLEKFATRPFFMVVSVDAPILVRYNRCLQAGRSDNTLQTFVQEHDEHFYGPASGEGVAQDAQVAAHPPLQSLHRLVNLHVINAFGSIEDLHRHLESLDLANPERLRPGWDTYFMRLASLASLRSNCMKRRVGAILVRHKRILSTGYNGTPRGLTNCNEGGCTRCNTASETSDECVCLHAEENALLEAGRDRVGDGAVLYCNTCPCLKCTIKIIQTGVREVVYNLSYKVDDASAALFKEAGVTLRRHAPPPDI
ncbi:cytidine deaminase-like protein [Phanerochaete sordida]|uniref:Deoxycytidylate deaminase n=1 Tax=Phanerochaete sordida TaxID=48140 RepID=A0A9P3LLR5_9APHY|nr:cytidine deaminase-like protein [Phanerochaete sordida]